MAAWKVLGSALTATLVVSVSAGATSQRTAACPAPKPLPASLKRPPAGASPTQLANFLLALPQRKPCDVSLFTSKWPLGTQGFYPEGRPMTPASGPALTDGQARARLAAFMPAGSKRARALRLFDRPDVKAKIPEPSFRAAFATLVGTVGESTIGPYLGPGYATIRVGGLPESVIGTTGAGAATSVIVNRKYEREHFALLSGTLAHEILHHDDSTPAPEEAILNALTAINYMQLLSRHPELATSGTELARQMNDLVILLVNSRMPGSPRIALVAPNGKGIAPGSIRTAPDLFTKFLREHTRQVGPDDTSPAPPFLGTMLQKLLAPGVKLPKPLTYSKKTAELFSRMNDTWLSPVDRLRVSVLLGLVSIEEIVEYTGLTRAKAITTFRLAPILAAMK